MKQQQEQTLEKWLICVDPDSQQIYTLNINTNEIRIESDVDIDYRKKAEAAIKNIDSMLNLKNGQWLMATKEIDHYRRRKIPSYLLHKQSSSYPTYLCQSTLSLAFSNVNSIKLIVKLNKYKDKLFEGSKSGEINEALSVENIHIIDIEAGLVTGADEVIKNVLREVYQRFKVMLRPKNEEQNQFILQIAGLKEYLTGNHPMLSYDRVRISLRGMKHLEVILTEVPKQNDQSQLFPPIITRVAGAVPEPINWQNFLSIPVLLWYAPVPIESYEGARKTEFNFHSRLSQFQSQPLFEQKQEDHVNIMIGAQKIEFEEKQASVPLRQSSGNLSQSRNRTSTKQRVNDLVSMKNELTNRSLLKIEHKVLYSGECDWPFSIRICWLENLEQAFKQDQQPQQPLDVAFRATYNGQIPPQYITKQNAKGSLVVGGNQYNLAEEQHNVVKKKDQVEEEVQKANHKFHLKLTGKGRFLDINKSIKVMPNKYISFGGVEGTARMKQFQETYRLDFIPYLISVQANIYHGCKLLTPWCQAETKKVPFAVHPKFFHHLQFPGIKISQLPQEARIGLNILIHSASGETQIVGSSTMYIFDDERRFRSGINALNMWPFYKIDPRLLCMGQYWGPQVSKEPHSSPAEIREFVKQNYCRLFIQLDQFDEHMKWSLRDEKQMEELGFSKSAKSQRYYEMKKQHDDISSTHNAGNASIATQASAFENDSFAHNSGQQAMSQLSVGAGNNMLGGQPYSKKRGSAFQGSGMYSLAQQNQRPYQHNPYEPFLNIGNSQEQGTQLRFDARDERTNHNFATSFNHMPQGSSLNIHGYQNQSISQFSSYRFSQSFTQQSTQQGSSQSDYISSIYPYKNWSTTPRTEDLAILQTLLKVNPLNRPFYTEQHKFILMICRNHYKTLPYGLQIFLMAIEWDDPEQVREAHNMIKLWTPLPPEDALPLLDAVFADETVRLYAVERVSILSDDELALYMLEFTQALMFEKHLFNPLAEFLLERSLQNPWVVGHELFWLLKSQLHVLNTINYNLYQDQTVFRKFRDNLQDEVEINDKLNNIALKVKDPNLLQAHIQQQKEKEKDKEKNENKDRDNYLRELLLELSKKMDEKSKKVFSFALDSRMEANKFYLEDCKVMNSKKLPLWLAVKSSGIEEDDEDMPSFKQVAKLDDDEPIAAAAGGVQDNVSININNNDDGLVVKDAKESSEKKSREQMSKHKIQIIFKNGDDIRQDMLTLQLIKIMDKIWLDAGLDFRMKPYKVIATQDQVGMIEVVRDSQTTEKIHLAAGTLGAFQSKSIWNYLKNKNTEPQSFEIATDNFLRSCAGYCVATFILGIGDRHSGNIMLTDTGHLFHIDFGHFLGNFKTKFGITRERAKFVLTEEMAFVMGGREGDLFKKFQTDCTNAYNMVRKHGHFLINVFLMNLSAGMPELQQAQNVRYLEEMLALNISDQEATTKFRQEIITSLNDTWRQIDNFFHNIKRR